MNDTSAPNGLGRTIMSSWMKKGLLVASTGNTANAAAFCRRETVMLVMLVTRVRAD
jgi:threonine synthase